MPRATRKKITEEQWKRAADAYERGTKHGAQIARELGVSKATVSRELKRRGCVKGSRVADVIAPLEAELSRQRRLRALMQTPEEEAAASRLAELNRLVDDMMRTIIAAAKAGDISKATPKIDEVGRTLGVRMARWSHRACRRPDGMPSSTRSVCEA